MFNNNSLTSRNSSAVKNKLKGLQSKVDELQKDNQKQKEILSKQFQYGQLAQDTVHLKTVVYALCGIFFLYVVGVWIVCTYFDEKIERKAEALSDRIDTIMLIQHKHD